MRQTLVVLVPVFTVQIELFYFPEYGHSDAFFSRYPTVCCFPVFVATIVLGPLQFINKLRSLINTFHFYYSAERERSA